MFHSCFSSLQMQILSEMLKMNQNMIHDRKLEVKTFTSESAFKNQLKMKELDEKYECLAQV